LEHVEKTRLTSEEFVVLQNQLSKPGAQLSQPEAQLSRPGAAVGVSSRDEAVMEFAAAEIAKLQDGLSLLAGAEHLTAITLAANAIVKCLHRKGKVLFCGNGGSAADAQHLAAELVGRQNYDRGPAAGIALSVDTSVLTAIGNDYSFDNVFARQVQALGRPGDVLVGISTSGRSRNVVEALLAARSCAMTTVAFTGRDPRDMAGADHVLAMPASETAKVQELQLVAGHIMFAVVERALFPREMAPVP
jgi:D-sedoheptulose 7-phosphate isomerase